MSLKQERRKAAIKENYPIGTRLKLNYLCNDERDMPRGLKGTVVGIDDQPALLMKWDNGRGLSLFPGEDSFTHLTREELIAEKIEPFEFTDYEDGTYGLNLRFTFLIGKYAGYGQEAFNNFAVTNGDPVKNEYGLYTHGSGYEWQKVFETAFEDDEDLSDIEFDCEAGGFYCYSDDPTLLERMGIEFKAICDDKDQFQELVNRALSDQNSDMNMEM